MTNTFSRLAVCNKVPATFRARVRRAAVLAVFGTLGALIAAGPSVAAQPFVRVAAEEPAEPLPSFKLVEKTVEAHLASIPKYRKGDLLSQGYVEPIFSQLQKHGWKVADWSAIIKLVPGDREMMVTKLRSDPKRQFMRGAAGYPDGYDRVDHLSRLSDANTLLWRLVAGPDGYKMVQYLTTAPGGAVMSEYLTHAPHGKGFNKPTGRIYTEAQLIKRLKQSYLLAEKERAKRR